MATLNDYASLITSEHSVRPNYMAVIAATCQPSVDIQTSLQGFTADFDLDTAVGAQLDAIGVRVGISRKVSVPITGVYFSLDVAGLGLDQGWLQGEFDPQSGIVSLDDPTFLLLIRCKIAANYWDGTIGTMYTILQEMFQGYDLFIQDNQDMSMYVGLTGNLPSAILQALFVGGYLPFEPAGVLVNYVVTPVSGAPLFGLDVENQYISGLDVGAIL